MESSPWLKLITVGLVLAALAVGYFLLSGKLMSNNTVKPQQQTEATSSALVFGESTKESPKPSVKQSQVSAYDTIANRKQSQIRELPKTGSQEILAGFFSIGIMVTGWSLRKFPH